MSLIMMFSGAAEAPPVRLIGPDFLINNTYLSRGSTGTATSSSGVVQTVAANVPRYNGTSRRMIIEGQRANLLLQSSNLNLTGGPWTPQASVTATQDAVTGPDGTLSADTLTLSAGVGGFVYQTVTVTASTAYTFSQYVRLGTLPLSDYKIAFYDATAAVFIVTDVSPVGTPNTSGWTRVTYTFTTPAGCTSLRVYPYRFTPVTGGTLHLWGAQLEQGVYTTTFIPTTTASVTRTSDILTFPLTTAQAAKGTVVGTFMFPAGAASDAYPHLINIASGPNDMMYFQNEAGGNKILPTLRIASAGTYPGTAGFFTPGTPFKLAISWDENGASFVMANGTVLTTASRPTVTQLRIGSSWWTGDNMFGEVGDLILYPKRITGAALQALTAP